MWRWVMSNGFATSNRTAVELRKGVTPKSRTAATTTREAKP